MTKEKQKKICENCAYFRLYNIVPHNEGQCRAHPPPWYIVKHQNWCGEFKYRNPPEVYYKEEPITPSSLTSEQRDLLSTIDMIDLSVKESEEQDELSSM